MMINAGSVVLLGFIPIIEDMLGDFVDIAGHDRRRFLKWFKTCSHQQEPDQDSAHLASHVRITTRAACVLLPPHTNMRVPSPTVMLADCRGMRYLAFKSRTRQALQKQRQLLRKAGWHTLAISGVSARRLLPVK